MTRSLRYLLLSWIYPPMARAHHFPMRNMIDVCYERLFALVIRAQQKDYASKRFHQMKNTLENVAIIF